MVFKEKEEPEEEEVKKPKPTKEKAKEVEDDYLDLGKEKTIVVKELPVNALRKVKDEDGNIVNLITMEESLTNIEAGIRKLIGGDL